MKRIILTILVIFILALVFIGINQNKEYRTLSDKSKLEIKKFDNKDKNDISLRGGGGRAVGGRIGGRIGGKIGSGKSSSGKSSGSATKSSPKTSESSNKNLNSKSSSKSSSNIKTIVTKTSYNNKYDIYSPRVYRPVGWKNIDIEIDNYRNSNPLYYEYPRWTYYFNPHVGYNNITRNNENDDNEWKEE